MLFLNILKKICGLRYHIKEITKIFGDEIIIYSSKNGLMVTFKSVGRKIFPDHFYKRRVPDIKRLTQKRRQ